MTRVLSSSECECVACGHVFSSESTFDRHQRGGVCLDPNTAKDRKGDRLFASRQRSNGVTWVSASAGSVWWQR